MKIKPSQQPAVIGITGHMGAGHVHSHSGFVQDDSAGFAVVCSLIKKAYPCDTTIRDVICKGNKIEVQTTGGGVGSAVARRGVTPDEADLCQRALGREGLYTQVIAFRCFGRMYGQGVTEAPVALQTAIGLAVLNTLTVNYPKDIYYSKEGPVFNVGACIAAILDVNGVSTAAMAILNATAEGLGPVEDLEGNLNFSDKGRLMSQVGLDQVPTIIIESKAYAPPVCRNLKEDMFWIRFNQDFDNPTVGQALIRAAQNKGIAHLHSDSAYPRFSGEMKELTEKFGRRIVELGLKIQRASSSIEKVQLAGELAILASQDAGGITYMSEQIHEIAAGGGLIPGMTAVLSMVVSPESMKKFLVPGITQQDIEHYLQIVDGAINTIRDNIDEARQFLSRSQLFKQKELEHLIN